MDTASRGFLGLLSVALGAYVLVGLAACLLLALLSYRVAASGVGALGGEAGELWPALIALAVMAGGVLFGLRSLASQILSSLRLNRRVRELTLPPTAALSAAVAETRLRGRVTLIDVDEAFSFAYGALRPRVAVSSGLLQAASRKELEAVLAHERYHVRNLDPLKVLLARALPQAFFYVPALRQFERRYLAGRELAADRLAAEYHGPAALAGALLKVVGGPKWRELQAATAIGGPNVLDARIAQLEEGREPRVAGVSPAAALLSFVWIAVLGSVVALAVEGSGGPSAVLAAAMPGMEGDAARLALMPLCFIPWAVVGWIAYRLLRFNAARELRLDG
ncbi:MAG TPA: M56 family metallopeptidase [Solirubrobacteraceae bacterium]|nr:M56 family metallopeptidase [Solirubrobacteraceae bacterium]